MTRAQVLASVAALILPASLGVQLPAPIMGEWRVVKQANPFYPALFFTQAGAVFSSRGDTIFSFTYTLDQPAHTLWLTDIRGERRAAKIWKLTADSLVVAPLWQATAPQRYARVVLAR